MMRHNSSTPKINTNNYLYSNITTLQPKTWYFVFCNPPFIHSISCPLLKICQKSIPLNSPWLEFINGIATNNSTLPQSQHNFNNTKPQNFQTSLTCNKKTPTRRHINCQTFFHYLLLATRIAFSSIKVSLEKHPPISSYRTTQCHFVYTSK